MCLGYVNSYVSSIPYREICVTSIGYSIVFLNRRAAAWYQTLASIIQGREMFSWKLSF